MYTGRLAEGRAVIGRLYRGADLAAFLKETDALVSSSPNWVGR